MCGVEQGLPTIPAFDSTLVQHILVYVGTMMCGVEQGLPTIPAFDSTLVQNILGHVGTMLCGAGRSMHNRCQQRGNILG